MTAKELLKAALAAQSEIETLKMERERLLALAGPATAKYSDMPGGGPNDLSGVERCVDGLMELDAKLTDQTRAMLELMRDADLLIRQVKKPRHREVLRLRYLCGLSWPQVRDKMVYTDVNSAHKIHGWALIDAERIWQRMEAERNGKHATPADDPAIY